MNRISSVYYGWGFLMIAGAGSYYFAKRSINADRAERQAMENEQRIRINRQTAVSAHAPIYPASPESQFKAHIYPSRLTPEHSTVSVRAPRPGEESKYESQYPFRSKKGDRFS